MQVSGHQIPDQNLATDFLEKILSRKCKIHHKQPCEYIHLKPSEFSPRLCCECMEVRDIPLNEAISIRLLLQASADTTFKAYPKFVDNSITQKIVSLKGSNDRISTELSSFFDKLNSTVSQAIEQVKQEQKQKLASLSNSYQDVFNSLDQVSQIVQFQELVNNSNKNEDKLKAFIYSQHSKIKNYTQTMNNKLLDYQKIEQSFSLSDADNRVKSIVKLIEGISLFSTIESNQQETQQPILQQQIQYNKPIQQPSQSIQQLSQQQKQLQQQQENKKLREQEQEKQLREQQRKDQQVLSYQQSEQDYYHSLQQQENQTSESEQMYSEQDSEQMQSEPDSEQEEMEIYWMISEGNKFCK